MKPPEIRVSRYEHSVAIKWAGDDNWYRFEPEDMRYGAGTERFKVGPGGFDDTADAEWVNPFDNPRPDIRRWTEPMRSELHSVPANARLSRTAPVVRLALQGHPSSRPMTR